MLKFTVENDNIYHLKITSINGSVFTISDLAHFLYHVERNNIKHCQEVKYFEKANNTLRENFDFEIKKAKKESFDKGFEAGQKKGRQMQFDNNYRIITKEEYLELQIWKDIKKDMLQGEKKKKEGNTMKVN
jgi:hypothetical protein